MEHADRMHPVGCPCDGSAPRRLRGEPSVASRVPPPEARWQADLRGDPVAVLVGRNERTSGPRAASSTTAELIAEWDTVSAKALKSRTKMPRPIAGLKLLKLPEPVGRQPLSYLFDIGFTRDVWAHRIDIAHVLAAEPAHDAVHDGRILADIVAEWAATHGEPFTLVLDGPAGGTFVQGVGGEEIHISVIDFVRTLAERTTASGILQHTLPL